MADDDLFPGVQVIERPFQQSRSTPVNASAFGAFVGKAAQGPLTPWRVRSWPQFTTVYGTAFTDLHYAVSDFFSNGGQDAYIQRIPGAGAVSATVNVYADDAPMDPANPGQVLPTTIPLFTLTALSPGAWGNRLHAVISPRDPTNKRFDLAIYQVPANVTFDAAKRNSEYLVEQWPDLSLLASDSRYMYDVVNPPSNTGSSTIRVNGQSYNPATPLVRPYPSTIGSADFGSGVGGVLGDDGLYTTISFDSDAAYIAAIDALDSIIGPYVLNLPNVSDSSTLRYAVNKAADRGDVFVVIDPPPGKTSAEMQSFAETDLALGTLGTSTPSYAAVYYPWVYLPAVGSSVLGRTQLRPPGGAIVGLMMATDSTIGVWQTPAGVTAAIAGAVDLERQLVNDDLRRLNASHINALRPNTGNGIVVWGARSLKKSGKDEYISTRRMMIYLSASLERLTQYAVFQPNGPRLWADLQNTVQRFLGGVWQQGGLKGTTAAEAFYAKCDAANNPPATTDAGIITIESGVAILLPAEFIIISIGQFDGGTTVTTTF